MFETIQNVASVLTIKVEYLVMWYCPVTDGNVHLEGMSWRPGSLICELFDSENLENHL